MPADNEALLTQFESEINELRNGPEPLATRLTIRAVGATLAALALLLAFARVDRVVSSASGRVVSVEAPIMFQSLDAAIVKSIDVREGEVVEAGQQLATLDPTFAAADVAQLRAQVASLDAQIARQQAELAGQEPPFAAPLSADQKLQYDLYRQRARQYSAQLSSLDEKIAQTETTMAKLRGDEALYRERLKIADQVLTMRTTLVERGAGTLLNMLVSTDAKLEAQRTVEFEHNSLVEAEHQAAGLRADRAAFVEQWRSSLSQDLVTARTARDNSASQLDKAARHQDLVRLVAPQRAMVLTLAKISVGSVLKEGDTLMSLAPMRAPLEAEVAILSRDVGFLRPGDPATLKVDAFNFTEHGVAEGKVRWVSEDAFTTDDNGAPAAPYYRARIAIDKLAFADVPKSFRLIPGMTLTADVKVGTRPIGLYLLGGLVKGVGDAMREP